MPTPEQGTLFKDQIRSRVQRRKDTGDGTCYSIDVRSGDLKGLKAFTSDILTTVEMKEIGFETQ